MGQTVETVSQGYMIGIHLKMDKILVEETLEEEISEEETE